MVDFVRPNYLGTLAEFRYKEIFKKNDKVYCRNMFENPINNGLCADSNPSDVKLARKRMYVLTKILNPFVKR